MELLDGSVVEVILLLKKVDGLTSSYIKDVFTCSQ